MNPLEKIPNSKFFTIVVISCISFIIIVARLIELQIQQKNLFLKKSKINFLHSEKIYSPRGNILDSNGNLLATNRPIYNVYWNGTGNHKLTNNQKQKLQNLSAIIEQPIIKNKKLMLQIEKKEKHYKKQLLASDLNFEQVSQIEEKFPCEQNIAIENNFIRFYPYGSYASHVLGYLGRMNFEVTGKMGLEHLFENILKGKPGEIMSMKNSFGRKLSEITEEEALAGSDIKTTLDLNLQEIVEEVFPSNQTGACILMDSENGSILAMTSRPNFNPSLFLEPILQKDWQSLQNEHPFLNRVFNAHYPPGSIFKLVVTSAALEHGIITPETIWNCKGYITFSGRRYHCHLQEGHGKLTVSQALEQSCNPLFYEVGTKMSIDTFADYAHRFGLGEKTNIIFPEKTGLIPSKKWKKETLGEKWWPGETLSAAVGQSFLLVTPIQVTRMIASIFSGYLITPRILLKEPVKKIPLNIKQETLDFLKQSMKKVVTQGTGKRVSRVKDIEIYAKTSTAQTSALHKRNKGRKYKEHGWFVSQFSYKQKRPITMVILVEHAGSSRIPTKIASKILVGYKKLIDKQTKLINS